MTVMIVGAVAIGLTLGLLGSGGSILTVPVLVYVVGHEGKTAIAESLAIVGGIALAGMIPYARAGQVNWRSVVFFGLPGMAGTYAGAWLSRFIPGVAQLLFFAIVMLLAAVMMFRARLPMGTGSVERRHAVWQVAAEGSVVGLITGLVGVGGGFLIVPALVLLVGLPMRVAVGTSLVIIAMNAASGFLKHLAVLSSFNAAIDLPTVVLFITVGMVGTLLGRLLSTRVNQARLRRGFALFLVLMAGFVLVKETPRLMGHAPAAIVTENRTM